MSHLRIQKEMAALLHKRCTEYRFAQWEKRYSETLYPDFFNNPTYDRVCDRWSDAYLRLINTFDVASDIGLKHNPIIDRLYQSGNSRQAVPDMFEFYHLGIRDHNNGNYVDLNSWANQKKYYPKVIDFLVDAGILKAEADPARKQAKSKIAARSAERAADRQEAAKAKTAKADKAKAKPEFIKPVQLTLF